MNIAKSQRLFIIRLGLFVISAFFITTISLFGTTQKAFAASPANLKIHDIEVNLLNGQKLFVPGRVRAETVVKTTSNGVKIPISSSPYNENHFDVNPDGRPDTSLDEFDVTSSLFTRQQYIWCGNAGGVPPLEFELDVTLLDRGQIGNDYVIVNGTKRYGSWRTITAVEGLTGTWSTNGRSIKAKSYNPYTTSVHFIFQEDIRLGNLNVWKYAPSNHKLDGSVGDVPEPIKSANVAITYPPRGFRSESRANPFLKGSLWSGASIDYTVDFEVPKGWRLSRAVTSKSGDQASSEWNYSLNVTDLKSCSDQYCVYRVSGLYIPLSGTLSLNLIYDKLGSITVNRCVQSLGTTFTSCNKTGAPDGETSVYNYVDNNTNNKTQYQQVGPKSTANGFVDSGIRTIAPYGVNNPPDYAYYYYRVKTTYSNGNKPTSVVVTENNTSKGISPTSIVCDTDPTSGSCWVDLVSIQAFNSDNTINLNPNATVNFIYNTTTPPVPTYNPWLQTKGGDVISQGNIRGPDSQAVNSDTSKNTGARIAGSQIKEAEYLIISAAGQNGGYFCSSQFYILTNSDIFNTGGCTNGKGYSVNYPSSLGGEDDAVIKSVNNLYTKNGSGNGTCRGTTIFTKSWTDIPSTVPASSTDSICVNGSLYKLTSGDKTTAGISSVNGRTTIFVDGKLTINGDIKYATTTSSDIRNIPNLAIIVNGDVNIKGSVSRIDAAIYAKGKVNTCYDLPQLSSLPTPCNYQLTINGMLTSSGLLSFNRTYVDPANLTFPPPAELIILTPQTYVFPPPGLDTKYFQDDALDAAVIDAGEYPPQF